MSRPFFRGRGRGFHRGSFRPFYHHHHPFHPHPLQRQEPVHVEVEKPAPLPLDSCLLYAEDFKARSQKRRALIAKALGIKHPDLLHYCIHSSYEITKLRARSYRYQSSLLARRRAKLAKQKAKEAKHKSAAALKQQQQLIQQQTQQPLQISTGTPLRQAVTEGAEGPSQERPTTPGLDGDSGGGGEVETITKLAPIIESETENINKQQQPVAAITTAAEEVKTDDANNNNSNNTAEEIHQAPATLSGGPQNDYSFHFICTGERPANFVRDVGLANRFEEYPKLRDLIQAKDELIQQTNTPPFCLKTDLSTFNLPDLGTEFDVVLIEPPLEDYRFMGQVFDKYWNWNEIEALNIGAITAPRSFVWLWVGAGEGLDRGRRCLSKWGFRRCEDIVWVKTNANHPGHSSLIEAKSLFQRTKEHCLMGIKGTVLRSKDGDFIHANIDLDVIIEEEPEPGVKDKPVEMFHIIEHFCLGRRRLHLFSRESTVRPGWVSVGSELIRSNYDPEQYRQSIAAEPGLTTGCTEMIERMRPKTPPLVKAAVAAQAAQAQATAATGQPVIIPAGGATVIQPSPLPPGVIAATASLGAALLQQQQQQQHCESPSLGL